MNEDIFPSNELYKLKWIERVQKIHGNFYDYSKVFFEKGTVKVEIVCPKHGSFLQRPSQHMFGSKCKKCSHARKGKCKLTFEDWSKRANIKHNYFFDYSLVEFKSSMDNIQVICPDHGEFTTSLKLHLKNKNGGCKGCRKISKPNYPSEIYFVDHNERIQKIIEELFIIHNGKYNYDFSCFKKCGDKFIAKCSIHGDFYTNLVSHRSFSRGCPKCNTIYSKGEENIKNLLNKYQIKFEEQKKFDFMISPNSGRKFVFDFYLPDYNLLIEFDGEQHFKPYRWKDKQRALEKFEKIQLNDNMKNELTKKYNISLLRIKYNENIEEKLILCLNLYSI